MTTIDLPPDPFASLSDVGWRPAGHYGVCDFCGSVYTPNTVVRPDLGNRVRAACCRAPSRPVRPLPQPKIRKAAK